MLRLDAELAKCGSFAPNFCYGHFQEIGIAALPSGLKPRHVEKFRECRLTDVGESELTDKMMKRPKKDRVRRTGDLNTSVMSSAFHFDFGCFVHSYMICFFIIE